MSEELIKTIKVIVDLKIDTVSIQIKDLYDITENEKRDRETFETEIHESLRQSESEQEKKLEDKFDSLGEQFDEVNSRLRQV